MLWAGSGTGNLMKMEGITKREGYVKTLKENLKHPVAKLGLGRRFVFCDDNGPKYTSLLVKDDIQKFKMNVTDWIEHPTSVPEDHQN